jgi:hypothetical protein
VRLTEGQLSRLERSAGVGAPSIELARERLRLKLATMAENLRSGEINVEAHPPDTVERVSPRTSTDAG